MPWHRPAIALPRDRRFFFALVRNLLDPVGFLSLSNAACKSVRDGGKRRPYT